MNTSRISRRLTYSQAHITLLIYTLEVVPLHSIYIDIVFINLVASFRDTLLGSGRQLLTRCRFPRVNRCRYLLDTTPGVNVHHKLLVCARHDPDIPINVESVVKLPGRFRLSMLHIPHLRIHSYLDSGIFAVGVGCFPGRCDKRRIGIDDGGGKIKNTADRHWVLERARIERDEGGACMGDGCCAAEGQFESLL